MSHMNAFRDPVSSENKPLAIKALLLGDRLDTSGLERKDAISATPFAFRVGQNGFAALFRYGAVVLFGLTTEEETTLLTSLIPRITGKLTVYEEETAQVALHPEGQEDQAPPGGPIHLRSVEPERILVIADVLAKSVALAHSELQIGAFFRVVDPLAQALATHGKLPRDRASILRLIGQSLIVSQRMSARVAVDDKPDILWDRADLERLYHRLEDEYELKERAAALADKVETVQHTAGALTDLIDAQRSLRLELTVVVLIAVEIGITFYDIFFRHF